MKILVLCLGRFGDLIHCLAPIQYLALQCDDGKCAVMVSEQFASVLDGCSYVEPIVVPYHFTDTNSALEHAKRLDYDRVLVARTSERNVGVTTVCESFTQEMWNNLGCLHLWNDLKLEFDLRDPWRERDLQKWHYKKFGVYNFMGVSSPLPKGETWLAHSSKALGIEHWYNLGTIRAHRIYDLLGIMERASIIVTCDTATLHLAAAANTRCINFIQHKPTRWHGSKPRNNSIIEMRYDVLDLNAPHELPGAKNKDA